MQKENTYEHGTFVFGESSSGQDYENEPGPSTLGNQDQSDYFHFWTNSYATDDDVLSNEKVSQELVNEMSQTVDEAKLHIKGNTRPEKIALSLHKFSTVRFSDNDIKERTSRWVMKCVKKFNPYARYDYKNLNKNDIEDMYLLIINHKVDDYAETGLLWSLSVFIRSTVIWESVHDFQLGGREPTRRELFRACFSTDGIAKNVEAANAIFYGQLTHLVSSVYDKMEELSSQLSKGATDEPGPQDVHSKVTGKDNNGPADLYGLGVRASDVWGVVPRRDSQRQGSSENASFCINVVNEPQPSRVGAEVYIKSIFNSTMIVAKGRIQSLDPNEIVGGEVPGPNWCELSVQVPIKRDEHLVR
uniref:Transposase Tnp1/En/Spm-like domain-containing protein n=1 Tax=Tanacetum cinerariifolium TaxID=118510 RepID=A0A699H0B1_TANCI|nr:hypothetical protein [Tanacetum cinerariifolium]